MTPTTTTIQSTSLYFRDGPSDKEYHASIEPKADGFIVTFAYGRRGNTLTVGTKTEAPVSLADATKVFDKLIASKVAKGYQSGFPGRPYSPGRPNTGGTQLKFKFVESASFVVTARNAKRSVSLGLFDNKGDGNTLVPAGNVTIPPNHAVPAVGEVCETKFLYAFRESGCIYQPVYVGKRCDIPASECTTDQLKYKSQAEAA